ncbi:YcjX family protein [Roseiarcus sp.]|uniref:YcjX family protein n=1 Tax=Roseiarcus sp. TaxID=1969460 RepID=UPI003F9A6054
MSVFSDLVFEAGLVARSLGDYFAGGAVRLGVTGLSRSGKTVFLTALVSNLIAGARLPVLAASAEGRITRARLEPQPDDAVPRFGYEDHVASLMGPDRQWPQSTRRISQLRLTIEFETANRWSGRDASLTLDLVDYPGEWLLDLPLLDKTYATWARETLAASETSARAPLAAGWRAALAGLDVHAEANEDRAREIAEKFTAYLRKARENVYALSTLPPGRFLMPGDLEGSPALTFAPIPLGEGDAIVSGTMAAMMERRYEAYKTHVVKPFFRDHFARLDRQIVLVDALTALNSGPAALSDLENALSEVLSAFRAGRASSFASIFRPRIDRILFAATKADHLHHTSHDRLEAILRLLTARAIARAEGVGAEIDVIALAAIRATREAEIRQQGEILKAIIGVPEKGETIGGDVFDGVAEAAVFPGELPADPASIFAGDAIALPEADNDWRFVHFRPPITQRGQPAPHIRLDRALQFLIGDRLA